MNAAGAGGLSPSLAAVSRARLAAPFGGICLCAAYL